jgi:hypothetical protein
MPSSKLVKKSTAKEQILQVIFLVLNPLSMQLLLMAHSAGCHYFCWVLWEPVLCTIWNSYVGWAWLMCTKFWMTCNTSCDYTLPTQHHKKQKHRHHDLPQPLAFSSFNFLGEYDCHMLHDWSQSRQHGDVFFIDETDIFFILLTIILQVLDRRAHELKVNYFSDYLLFFLAIALKQHALTISIHQYFNRRCPPSPHHVLAWFRLRGARRHCHPHSSTHTQVPR